MHGCAVRLKLKFNEPSVCPYCGSGAEKKRSTYQNKLYWAILNLVSDQLYVKGSAFSSETWHEYFKQRYLGCKDVLLPNGKTISISRSTSGLPVDEFGEYVDRVQAWATEHGVDLSSLHNHLENFT